MELTETIPATDYTKYACNVFVNGQPLSADFQIISLQIKQGYQYITSAQINFKQSVGLGNSAITSLVSSNLPVSGSAITIKAKLKFDELVLFDGNIVKHTYKNSSSGTRLQVMAKNKPVNMALTMQTEVFAKQTDKEIIESIASKHGFSLATTNLTNQFLVKHTQLVKNGLNDWDFINVRAEANGCFVYTEKDVITLDKPTPQLNPEKIITARYGRNVYELELEQDERKYQIENELISFNLSTFENETTREDSTAGTTPARVKGKNSDANYRTFNDREATDILNAETQLKTLSKHNGVTHIKADLTAKPGGTVEISGFNELIDGKFIITSVMQDYSDGGFSTYLQFGLNHESYACKYNVHEGANRPAILTGTVTQLQDDPDNLSRIQVKISGWQYAQESVWARVSTLYAGDNYGMVMLPEIGDEVIVAFIGNDSDVPVVLGSAFSPKFPPHTPFKDDNYDKVFITKKGMKWAWNDEKGIHEVSTPNGNKVLISEEDKSITIEDENANKIVMNSSEISLTGSKDITIKATANIKIEGAKIDIIASGINTIKGSIVKIN